MSITQVINKTATSAAFFGLVGYACLEVAKNNIHTVAQLFDGAKISYFVKNPITKTPMIDPIKGGLCCAMFVIIDAIANQILNAINPDSSKNNEFYPMARMTFSLITTAKISQFLGVTSTLSSGIGLLATSAVVYAVMYGVFKICNSTWHLMPAHARIKVDQQPAKV